MGRRTSPRRPRWSSRARVLGAGPPPRDVERHLRVTARDLDEDFSHGAGLVDVAAAQRFAVGTAPG